MKIFKLVIASLISAASATGSTFAQALPETPSPVQLSDPAWNRLQNIAYGTPIVVTDIRGQSVHCLFAQATDAYLFCWPPGNPPEARYRLNHADVIGVDVDMTARSTLQPTQAEHNYHPAWISSMIAGGFIVGLIASQNTDAGRAAEDGLIGAGIVGIIGAPIAFLPHAALPEPTRPYYGLGIRLSPHRMHPHGMSAVRLFR
jgi:hypothetical protein